MLQAALVLGHILASVARVAAAAPDGPVISPTIMAAHALEVFGAIPGERREGEHVGALAATLVTAGMCNEAEALFLAHATGPAAADYGWQAVRAAIRMGDKACAARMAVIEVGRISPAGIARAPFDHARNVVMAGARLRVAGREEEGLAYIQNGYAKLWDGASTDVERWEYSRKEAFWLARAWELSIYRGMPQAMPVAEQYAVELAARPNWADETQRNTFVTQLAKLDRKDLTEPLLPTLGRHLATWDRVSAAAAFELRSADPCARDPMAEPLRTSAPPPEQDVVAALALDTPGARLWKLLQLAEQAVDAGTCAEQDRPTSGASSL